MATMNLKTGTMSFTAHDKQLATQAMLLTALKRCIAALAANGAPNCEAVKEAKAALAKARTA